MPRVKSFAVIGGVFLLALIARYQWIEPTAIGEMCRAMDPPWHCQLRRLLILTFVFEGLGYASFIVGVLAVFFRRRGMALLGASLGAAGLVLYCYELAAVGFLLSVLTLARQTAPGAAEFGYEHSEGEQHA